MKRCAMSSLLNFAAIACYSRLVFFSCVLHALRSLSHVLNTLVRVRRKVVVKSFGDDNGMSMDSMDAKENLFWGLVLKPDKR